MEACFVPKGDTFLRRPLTALTTVLKKDRCRIPAGGLELDHLRLIAEDRTQWRRLSATI